MSAQRTNPTGPKPYDRGSAADGALFTRNLRYELASEEGRALAGSYAISFLLGIAFLLFVYLYPPIERPVEPQIIVYDIPPEQVEVPPPPAPVPEAAQPQPQEAAPAPRVTRPQRQASPSRPAPRTTTQVSRGDVAGAFGQPSTGGVAGSIAGTLRGVDVRTGTGGDVGGGGTGQRAVIGGGTGSGTANTPGRGGVSANPGAGGAIGNVGGSGGVSRGTVGVSAPRVEEAPPIGEGRNMNELGQYVRSRYRELQFCYEEHGLKVNPNLGGTVRVSIGIAGSGRVTSARVASRTWGGAGASAVESCILGKIRAWRFPSSSAGDGVYSFPFNFTR